MKKVEVEKGGVRLVASLSLSSRFRLYQSKLPMIHLAAVVEYKHLAVLEGGHRAGVGVEVRVCFWLSFFFEGEQEVSFEEKKPFV